MFIPNYITAGIKTKEQAIKHALEAIIESPGCADMDGTCGITVFNQLFILKPKKKKKAEEI